MKDITHTRVGNLPWQAQLLAETGLSAAGRAGRNTGRSLHATSVAASDFESVVGWQIGGLKAVMRY